MHRPARFGTELDSFELVQCSKADTAGRGANAEAYFFFRTSLEVSTTHVKTAIHLVLKLRALSAKYVCCARLRRPFLTGEDGTTAACGEGWSLAGTSPSTSPSSEPAESLRVFDWKFCAGSAALLVISTRGLYWLTNYVNDMCCLGTCCDITI